MHLIKSSLQYIHELLDNMLVLHQTSVGIFELYETRTNIYDVLVSVRSMLLRHSSAFTMEVECPKTLTIMADKLRLKQVILNLAKNSTKFVEKGFIRLSADRVSQNELRIRVEDSGPGIPEELKGKLFRKYEHVSDRLRQGSGIGLSLCKGIVDAMGGRLEIRDDYDSGILDCPGASFGIYLPRKDAEVTHVEDNTTEIDCNHGEENAFPPAVEGIVPRFLIVDSNESFCDMLKRALVQLFPDSKVKTALSVTAAEALLTSTFAFDVILIEQSIPEVDDLFAQIQQYSFGECGNRRKAKVVLMADGSFDLRADTVALSGYVRKPLPNPHYLQVNMLELVHPLKESTLEKIQSTMSLIPETVD